MSNNKQSSVEYLIEQVKSKEWSNMFIWHKEEIFKKAKQMEKEQMCLKLPSDKDIDKQAFQVPYDGTNEFYDKSFIKGATWMRDKILNQNK